MDSDLDFARFKSLISNHKPYRMFYLLKPIRRRNHQHAVDTTSKTFTTHVIAQQK